jgi:hypothetical protein
VTRRQGDKETGRQGDKGTQIRSMAKVLDCVEIAGSMALAEQGQAIPVERSCKRDGSVLTKTGTG